MKRRNITRWEYLRAKTILNGTEHPINDTIESVFSDEPLKVVNLRVVMCSQDTCYLASV
jgi:hypothetical protein